MSQETKLPEECVKLPIGVMKQIDEVAPEKHAVLYNRARVIRGATIAAAHYQSENKRLMELLKDKVDSEWSYKQSGGAISYEVLMETYWQQYCKDNNLKEE